MIKLALKDYVYIILIVLLLNFCIFSYREYGHCANNPGGSIHPECISPVKAQRFRYGYIRH